MYNVAFLFKQHLMDKIPFSSSCDQSIENLIIKKSELKKHNTSKDKSRFFSSSLVSLERDIHLTGNTTNGSDACGSNEKLNINGTNSSHSSGSGKKKKCKRRHRYSNE